MAIGPMKIHGVSPRDALDRAAFIAAFVLGTIGVIVIKTQGGHPFLAAGYAVLILVIYAIAAWVGGRIKLEPETVGDNCYYLGFLLTLSSLAYALYRITSSASGSDRAVNVPELISGFGVALSSTIAGVFLRVLLMQLRTDFVAKDREIRADINRAFGDFKKNMSGILQQMKAFSTEAVQMAAERDERIRKSTENVLERQLKAIEDASRKFADNLERTLLKASEITLGKVEASIEASSRKSGEAMEAFVEQELGTLRTLEERRNRLASEFAESVRQMKAHSEEMEKYIRVTRKAADAMTEHIVPALDDFRERLDKLPETPLAEASSSKRFVERQPIATLMRWLWFPKRADRS